MRRGVGRAFTLIELLVVMSVIAVLIGILVPSLAGSRESARRVKCLSNLRSMGTGFQLYLNANKEIFPAVRPLHGGGEKSDASLLDLLADYVDAAIPRRDADGVSWIVADPYRCPSDVGKETGSGEPLWRSDGTSYEYLPGVFMLAAELFFGPGNWAFAVTRAYEADRRWPILSDQGDWHDLRRGQPAKNAVLFPDMRADWVIEIPVKDMEKFFDDVRKFGGF